MMETIRNYRLHLGDTQAEVAEVAGLCLSYYKKLETGKRQPGRLARIGLLRYLHQARKRYQRIIQREEATP